MQEGLGSLGIDAQSRSQASGACCSPRVGGQDAQTIPVPWAVGATLVSLPWQGELETHCLERSVIMVPPWCLGYTSSFRAIFFHQQVSPSWEQPNLLSGPGGSQHLGLGVGGTDPRAMILASLSPPWGSACSFVFTEPCTG